MTKPPELWYFAYGANMDRATLVERRRIEPLEVLSAALEGYELVFNQRGIAGIEPSFANLKVAQGEVVHGVAYGLTASQLEELDALEGGGAYDHLEVTLRVAGGGALLAKTYVTTETVEGRLPSRRYMGLLVRGARERGLPNEWLARLESQPTGGLRRCAFLARPLMGALEIFFRMGFRARRLLGR